MLRMVSILLFMTAITTFAGEQTGSMVIEGEIIDMGCYTSREARGEEHATCAARCISNATPAGVLTDEGKVYTIAGPSTGYSTYAAMTVRLTGPVRANAIRPEKMEVKASDKWKEIPVKFGAPKTDD